ncbi:succinate dehydrogenase assembly factor 2 family protein [Neisseria sp. N95_16]|uniref:FAD assembly factor SdhE n=1 Tax=Neisseria brasiliensis TaxID=2666100 RepID=A0A5Q3S2R3_9NEIS|nr:MULTISPECIES: succinate dehydrogenase assembly factor 2 [Neisseria]MRN37280.1 succinate dehydrogenase assembly factor 2 family protein [Neisseria brasiliensis]PJO10074.1 succinate dehydrogenase assembly factor 2 family protein [Neisseria sp. N95_16]PJO78330.1 succinate dehydrogenase assembly factor 2 family protein [Neisseria sp. N177_16]QGL26480.1 succinate dehydrogenase assembly factor 2 family protein [Neisseria brasiliensis]
MMVFDDTAKRKIRFQTRRGLLELDLVLGRFMEREFEQLNDEELAAFVEILEFQDQDLLALVNGYTQTEKTHLIPLLNRIRQA